MWLPPFVCRFGCPWSVDIVLYYLIWKITTLFKMFWNHTCEYLWHHDVLGVISPCSILNWNLMHLSEGGLSVWPPVPMGHGSDSHIHISLPQYCAWFECNRVGWYTHKSPVLGAAIFTVHRLHNEVSNKWFVECCAVMQSTSYMGRTGQLWLFEGPTCAQTQIHLKPIPILPYLVLGQFALKVGYVGLHPEGTFSCTNVIALMDLRSSSFLNLNLGAIYKRIIIEILQQQDVIVVDAVCWS